MLTEEQKKLVALLRSEDLGQGHLVDGIEDADPKGVERLLSSVAAADASYPGGLRSYVANAKQLLKASAAGENAFAGMRPEVPQGEALVAGSAQFAEKETLGLQELDKTCFVLVAGGLGERLGYAEAKISLPSEITTGRSYCELYIRSMLAIKRTAEKRCGHKVVVPFVIMTSDDTNQKTKKLLEDNDYFGFPPEDVTILLQQKVPAMVNSEAMFAVSSTDRFKLEMKPHGHGDVHTLLHQSGLPKKWAAEGRKWLFFFQDTNGLVFKALCAVIGVSVTHGFAMNTIAVPRKATEAVGGLCKLVKPNGNTITINVEYNQLGPLLSASHFGGDLPDPKTGRSCFPGNTNSILVNIPRYAKVLEEKKGAVPEFVNPKYSDSTQTKFKSPARLECMMQDLPLLLSPSDAVGFTQLDRWLCFSTVKNNVQDAAAKSKSGGSPESAFTGEADQYENATQLLRLAAIAQQCKVDIENPMKETWLGVEHPMGPHIVIDPSFGVCLEDFKKRIVPGSTLKISRKSTLILEGDVTINGLELDGALIVTPPPGKSCQVEDIRVTNAGWRFQACAEKSPVINMMRGYDLVKHDQCIVN